MMKGKLKQLISILLISVLVLSMAAPGFAATGTHTLTINSQTSGHTFEIYQVFEGDVDIDSSGNTVLTDITWGTGIDTDGFVEALKATKDTNLTSIFANIDYDNTSDLAAVIAKAISDSKVATNSDAAYAFADLVGANLNTSYATSTQHSYNGDNKGYFYYYTITGLEDGYYFLKDADDSLKTVDDVDTSSYTRYILSVVGGDLTINAKADKPNIDKHIGATEKTEEYNFGDDIPYQLNSKVPDMEGYDAYWFMAHDSLSEGLDFQQVDSVTVGNRTLDKARQVDHVYEVTGNTETLISELETPLNSDETTYSYTVYNYEYQDSNGVKTGTELYIVLNKFYESYKDTDTTKWSQEPIVINYTVHFNKNATIGVTGNENEVELIYSNNPNYKYAGKEPTPDTKDGVGNTTKKTTVTFTTALQIQKEDEKGNKLAGASFKLEEYGSTAKTFYTWEATANYKYFEDSSGLYVDINEKLDNVAAEYIEDDNSGKYTDYTHYSRTTDSEKNTYTVTTDGSDGTGSLIGTSGTDGLITFKGLGAGIYMLTEVSAPSGYNKMTSPLYVKIVYTDPAGYENASALTLADQPTASANTATWEFYEADDPTATFPDGWTLLNTTKVDGVSGSIGYLTAVNIPGALLPATGGVGTIVFTVVGLCAMAGAVLFLYTRRRREEE